MPLYLEKSFFNMDELVSNHNINPVDYKNLYPLFVFDVTKQSEKLKTAVSNIHFNFFLMKNLLILWHTPL